MQKMKCIIQRAVPVKPLQVYDDEHSYYFALYGMVSIKSANGFIQTQSKRYRRIKRNVEM